MLHFTDSDYVLWYIQNLNILVINMNHKLYLSNMCSTAITIHRQVQSQAIYESTYMYLFTLFTPGKIWPVLGFVGFAHCHTTVAADFEKELWFG